MDTPEPRIQIEPMTMENITQVEALEKQCFSVPWSIDSLAQELSNPMAVFYTAHIDGEIAGYAGMHHIIDEGYIANIAVSPAHRRRGIASALVGELLAYAEENELAMLTLEVRASNEAAIALYTRFGFEPAGHRRRFYTGPVEDAIIMTRQF